MAAAALAAAAVPGLAACAPAREPARLLVYASIQPYAWFLERLGGGELDVAVLVGPGQTPETFEPGPRDLARLGEARALFAAGVPFERALLPRVRRALPEVEIVDTLAGLPLRAWEEREDDRHAADGHDHGTHDPHLWLDPELARGLARNLAAALARLDPARAAAYEARRAALDAELAALDAELSAALAPWRGRAFYVYHPAFGYFAARFGLRQVAIQAGGREPTPRELARVIEAARADGARTLFAQPQYAPRSARKVADAIGAELGLLDDLARDYPANLRRMAAAVAAALAPTPGTP